MCENVNVDLVLDIILEKVVVIVVVFLSFGVFFKSFNNFDFCYVFCCNFNEMVFSNIDKGMLMMCM